MRSSFGRFLLILLFALWWGGLTFYSAVVVPFGAERIGARQQGVVTRDVTPVLNYLGIMFASGAMVLAWKRQRRVLAICSGLLGLGNLSLFSLHRTLDQMLNVTTLELLASYDVFYSLHRIYLIITAVIWFAGLAAAFLIVLDSSVAREQVSTLGDARAEHGPSSSRGLVVLATIFSSSWGVMTSDVGAAPPSLNADALVAANDRDARMETPSLPMARRRPSSLAVVGPHVWVAQRERGFLSVVDPEKGSVVGEWQVGKSLVSLAAIPHRPWVLGVDRVAGELLLLSAVNSQRPTVVARTTVPFDPVEVVVDDAGAWAVVASCWSRRVTVVDLASTDRNTNETVVTMRVSESVDLPFAPKRMKVAPDHRHVAVADAFGGGLAIVDRERPQATKIRQVSGHHLDGLATSHDGRNLLVTHQVLNGREVTNDDPVFWGALLNNVMQSFTWDELLADSDAVSLDRGVVLPLGEPSHGTGDPGAIWIGREGRSIVCLSGVDELSVRANAGQPMTRKATGRRPVAVAANEARNWAVVANQLDDSLTVVDLPTLLPRATTISLGPMPEASMYDEGERLFYDSRLSLDGWFSCHSCHVDGHSNHLVNDNFGDDSFGAPKRVPSLLGAGASGPWAWNGRQANLSAQIGKSLVHTMRGGEDAATERRVAALQAYVESLAPAPPLAKARSIDARMSTEGGRVVAKGDMDDRESMLEKRGRELFERRECGECHRGPSLSHESVFDVGLRDERGESRFNPPSLRGVSQRDAFLHDARVRSLEELFTKSRHPSDSEWKSEDVEALVAYLKTL